MVGWGSLSWEGVKSRALSVAMGPTGLSTAAMVQANCPARTANTYCSARTARARGASASLLTAEELPSVSMWPATLECTPSCSLSCLSPCHTS